MKLILPEHIGEITLEQFQKYNLLLENKGYSDIEFENKKIAIFTKLDEKSCELLTQKDRKDCLDIIDNSLNHTIEFTNKFDFNGKKYGFIPNLDNISGFEFADLTTAGMDVQNLHVVMAVLFRPIIKEEKILWFFKTGNYQIEPYNGTQSTEEGMKQLPLHLVNGALFFFLNLAKELRKDSLKSTEVELKKVKTLVTTLRSGGGMQPLPN
jgi:hypothetical protein